MENQHNCNEVMENEFMENQYHYNEVMLSKSPISWVEEISVIDNGNKPIWSVSEMKTPFLQFRAVVTVRYKDTILKAEATHARKKFAKHDAAKNMLDNQMKLSPKDYFEINEGIVNSPNPELNIIVFESPQLQHLQPDDIKEFEIGKNPSEELLALCEILNISPPIYDPKDGIGPSHRLTFECLCTIEGETKSETAKSKKQAKRRVAHRWIMTLKGRIVAKSIESTSTFNTSVNGVTNGEAISGMQHQPKIKLQCNKSLEICLNIVSHRNHMYQKISGELINQLKSGVCDLDFIEAHGGAVTFLNSLGRECNFVVDYKDLKATQNSKVLSILIIKGCDQSELDLVLFGTGDNEEDSRNMAAQEAINHIKTLAK